jgi:hypothetical protein
MRPRAQKLTRYRRCRGYCERWADWLRERRYSLPVIREVVYVCWVERLCDLLFIAFGNRLLTFNLMLER